MKDVTMVWVSPFGKESEEFSKQFEPYIPKDIKGEFFVPNKGIPFEDNDPMLKVAIDYLIKRKIKYDFSHRLYLTQKELEEWPLFYAIPRYPLEIEGKDAYDYGTKYEKECPHCVYRENRIGDLLVERKFMQKKKFGCLPPDYFVTDVIKERIEESGLTGVTFDSTIKDYKGREINTIYTMKFDNILPPMHESAWWREWSKSCSHHVVYCDSEYRYDRKTLTEIKDFNLTYEYLNNHYARELIVSGRARKFFKENGTRTTFWPVKIID